MATRAPRHLAEPPKRFGLSQLQQVFLGAMLSLAAITLVIALLTRDAGNGGRRAVAPATTRAQAATTAAAATTIRAAATTTAPAAQPIRPTPGNLLADGDFERDLAGWTALGGAEVERVRGGASGRWAAAVVPGASDDGAPGMIRRDAATAKADTTYEASFWVQAPPAAMWSWPCVSWPAAARSAPTRPATPCPAAAGSRSRSSTTRPPPAPAWPWRSSAT